MWWGLSHRRGSGGSGLDCRVELGRFGLARHVALDWDGGAYRVGDGRHGWVRSVTVVWLDLGGSKQARIVTLVSRGVVGPVASGRGGVGWLGPKGLGMSRRRE